MTPSTRYVFARERFDGVFVWSVREIRMSCAGHCSWTDALVAYGESVVELSDDLAKMAAAAADPFFLDLTVEPPGLRKRGDRHWRRLSTTTMRS